jgi:uncharacterized protein (UPF0335 family)
MPRKRKGDTPDIDGGGNAAPVAGAQLKSVIERIERLTEEKAAITDDIKDVMAEAKGHGFDTKIIRVIIRRRAMDAAERAEQDALIDIYSKALGMASPADTETD